MRAWWIEIEPVVGGGHAPRLILEARDLGADGLDVGSHQAAFQDEIARLLVVPPLVGRQGVHVILPRPGLRAGASINVALRGGRAGLQRGTPARGPG